MSTKVETTPKRRIRLFEVPQDIVERGRGMADLGRDIWLAGLGAVATVEEEGSTLFETLVSRGEKVEKQGRKQLGEVQDDLTARQKELTRRLGDSVEPLMAALQRFGVPTRGEVHDLSVRVDRLSRKVDALLNRLGAGARPRTVFTVAIHDDGWAVTQEGGERPAGVFATKEEALDNVRTLAHEHEPAVVHVHRKDGTLQETLSYGE